MYCKNCGEQLQEKQAVCLKCGVARSKGSNFCEQCGAPMDGNKEFCAACGYKPQAPQSVQAAQNDKKTTATVLGVTAILLGVFGIFFNTMLDSELSILFGIAGVIVSTLGRQYESVKKQCTAGLILAIIALSAGMLTSILTKYFDIFSNL